ncbi:MAG: hypothetical protein WBA74_20120 [Cyclobacteriaceae bacterium]
MEAKPIDKLVNRVYVIQHHLETHENDPLLVESYQEYYDKLKERYGYYLSEKLFEIYDEHCSDNEIQDIKSYLSREGVNVEADDFPGIKAKLFLKTEPLRIVMSNPDFKNERILWKVS